MLNKTCIKFWLICQQHDQYHNQNHHHQHHLNCRKMWADWYGFCLQEFYFSLQSLVKRIFFLTENIMESLEFTSLSLMDVFNSQNNGNFFSQSFIFISSKVNNLDGTLFTLQKILFMSFLTSKQFKYSFNFQKKSCNKKNISSFHIQQIFCENMFKP